MSPMSDDYPHDRDPAVLYELELLDKAFFILFFYDSFNHPCVNETVVNYSVSIISQKRVATKLIG